MVSDDRPRQFVGQFDGEIPDPPRGPAEEVARTAWKMGWKAEKLADSAATHALTVYERVGEVAASFTEEMTRRFDEVSTRFDTLESDFRYLKTQLAPQVAEAERHAQEAKTSSHDLSEEVEKMESILSEIKHKSIDSVRIKQLVVEEHQMLVTKQELDRLQKREAVADKLETERRSYRLTTRSAIVSGIIVAVFGIVATYFATKATTGPAPATLVAPSH